MRILISTDTVGGVWDHTLSLVRELARARHAVIVAAFAHPLDRRLSRAARWAEVEARDLRLEWMPGSWQDVDAGADWLTELARRWSPDVVHLNQFACAVRDFGAPKVVAAHGDVLSWWSEVRGCRAPGEWAEYESRVRAGLGAADAVVAPSAYQSGLLARHYGRTADRVIWNGVAPPQRSLDRKPSPLLLLTAARAWDPAKGVRVLDAALTGLGGRAPAAVLLGETVSPQGTRLATRSMRALGRMERPHVDRWLRRATVYVAPSLYEPFGLAPLEAALHGCALLLSDLGSFRELWGEDAAYFPAGNSAALAEAILELVSASQRVARLAHGARRRARTFFSAERMGRDYLALYAALRGGRQVALAPRSMASSGAPATVGALAASSAPAAAAGARMTT